ncbi:hypothetical protein [Aquimarina sp. 2201CG5-10]|uniref:hypothetical protein n=1 Tax=Aquimarina callyspongiae TaxID=3098150 RepID=UPI002AB386C8|nr:hypothetical protein [Aquimarina sp. 2201CG5-10]MDY8135066.1 hypothetical protein [Aquimarina sp. 2201CG5-10]
MNTITRTSSNLLVFGIPLLIIASMILITQSKIFATNPNTLSIGITIDLLFTAPLVYFLLIRKKKIPKTTIVPLFVLGIIITSFIIPKENQSLLNWVKTWVFPLVEIGVATFIFYKVRQTLKLYKNHSNQQADFFTALQNTCKEILPKRIATLLAMELAVFYYGFISWKKRITTKNEFTYHKNSGTIGLFIALIGIIGIETYVLHILLAKWSIIAAWIASGLSIYSGIQILGFLKSITKRPISIENEKLYLRYGILSETTIDISAIQSIELSSKDIELTAETRKLSPLGDLESHNTIITLKEENTLNGLYGIKKTYKQLALFIDNKEEFKSFVEHQIELIK